MDNREYARVLYEIATLQRIAGDNFFKVRAFERAARLIEELPEELDVLLDGHRAEVLRGVGESIETELQALRMHGVSPRHEELLSRIGPGVFQLMDLQGLGMRRLQVLFQEAGIASMGDLKRAARRGALRHLPSFGEAIEQKVLQEIDHWERTRGKRFPLPEAKGLADSIRLQLLELSDVDRAEVGGSIRRGRETIGDVDILVTTNNAASVSGYFKSLPEVTEVIFDGDTRASVRVIGGIQIDLRVLDTHLFGAGLHYFTGSKEHHIAMRLRSKKIGLKISEHGVCRYDDPDEVLVGPMDEEEDVFAAVGLPYIPPEIRMGKDEIELAELDSLPALLDVGKLRGDVHVATSISSGREPLDKLASEARRRGYEWIVACERSRGVDPRAGLDSAGFQSFIESCREAPEREGVRVLCGAEVSVSLDGLFDVDHRVLASCDWVTVTYGSAFGEDADANTRAIVWAIETGLVSCLGSPTGRRLGVDDGPPIYFDEVLEACLDFGVALELNGHPGRLDLNAQLAARARQRGALLVLGSEATSASGMANIDYAVQQARRAWLEPRDVLNSLSAEELVRRTRRLVR